MKKGDFLTRDGFLGLAPEALAHMPRRGYTRAFFEVEESGGGRLYVKFRERRFYLSAGRLN